MSRAIVRSIFSPLMGKKSRANGRDHFSELPAKVHTLETALKKLRLEFDRVTGDADSAWLYRNRVERMDATQDFFDPLRREFHLSRYRFAAKYAEGKEIADIASGTGYGAALLRETGHAARVMGVDISMEAVEYARRKHAPDSVEYLCNPGEKTGLPDQSFDMVTSFETIEHVPDDDALLREFRRILRPGGSLIVSTPNDWPLEIAPCHERTYTLQSFREVLEKHFEVWEVFNQNSGSKSKYNHDQPPGIWPTTPQNESLAECYIAVCRVPQQTEA